MSTSPPMLLLGPSGAGVTTAQEAFADYGYVVLSNLPLEGLADCVRGVLSLDAPVLISLAREVLPEPADIRQLVADLGLQTLLLTASVPVRLGRCGPRFNANPDLGDPERVLKLEDAAFQALKPPVVDYHIDTSAMSADELRYKIARVLGQPAVAPPMTVSLKSFGFKHGPPVDADLVFDMRFLRNPFYEPELRPMTGLDAPVRDYVFGLPAADPFFRHWTGLLSVVLPAYQAEGKQRVTIAIGCTGGQHRSVCMTEALARDLQERFPDFTVRVTHRDASHWGAHAAARTAVGT